MNVDDTNITLPGNCIRDIEETLNRDLMNIKDWLLANKLSLHVTFSLSLFLSFSLPFLSLHPPSRPVPLFLVSLCATLLAKNSLPNNYFMQCFLNTATQNPPQSQDLISMTHQCCPWYWHKAERKPTAYRQACHTNHQTSDAPRVWVASKLASPRTFRLSTSMVSPFGSHSGACLAWDWQVHVGKACFRWSRFPTAARQRTKHQISWCRDCVRWILGPSTW